MEIWITWSIYGRFNITETEKKKKKVKFCLQIFYNKND